MPWSTAKIPPKIIKKIRVKGYACKNYKNLGFFTYYYHHLKFHPQGQEHYVIRSRSTSKVKVGHGLYVAPSTYGESQ
jgi:hypothetical protein